MNVWQVATGLSGRDYRDVFFEHDVMIMGPGYKGSALETDYRDGVATSIGNQIHRFAHDPVPGDRVVMRFSQEIIGIGEIPSGDKKQYSFDEAFRTVYGWELRHCRRVKWAKRGRLGPLSKLAFGARQNPTFTRVHQPRIVKAAQNISQSWFNRPLRRMPTHDTSLYSEEELGTELFAAGISSKNVQDIYAALRQAHNLHSWYSSQQQSGRWPTEHEVLSHIILPLFLGLGWSHQQMAVEWNRIDLAFFKTTPTSKKNCVMVLEAKGMDMPLGDILEQAIHYVEENGLRRANRILVTNGATLFVYGRKGASWDSTPLAFLDVTCLQKEYILPRKTNPVDTLVMLQPSAL